MVALELNAGRDPNIDPLRAKATASMVISMAIRDYLKQRLPKRPIAAA